MFAEHSPIEPLSSVVASVWTLTEQDTRSHTLWADLHSDLLIVVDGQLSVAQNGRRRKLPSVTLLGPRDRTLILQSDGPLSLIGVQLEPWATQRFLRASAASVARTISDYVKVWTNPVPIRDWMLEAPESERVHRLQLYLLTALGPPSRLDAIASALGRIYKKRGDLTVDELAESAGLNVRALQRGFHEVIGLSPKRCIDVVRFNYARHRLLMNPKTSLSRVAAQCGYADQAHFSRAFRRFFGLTPREVQQSSRAVV